jgi:hypothetical protein
MEISEENEREHLRLTELLKEGSERQMKLEKEIITSQKHCIDIILSTKCCQQPKKVSAPSQPDRADEIVKIKNDLFEMNTSLNEEVQSLGARVNEAQGVFDDKLRKVVKKLTKVEQQQMLILERVCKLETSNQEVKVERSPLPVNFNIKVASVGSSEQRNVTSIGTNTECMSPLSTPSTEQTHQINGEAQPSTSDQVPRPKPDERKVTVKLDDNGKHSSAFPSQHDSGSRNTQNFSGNSQELNSIVNTPITQSNAFPERNVNSSYRRPENDLRPSRGSYNQQQQSYRREGSGGEERPQNRRRSLYRSKNVCLYTTLPSKASIVINSATNLKLSPCP